MPGPAMRTMTTYAQAQAQRARARQARAQEVTQERQDYFDRHHFTQEEIDRYNYLADDIPIDIYNAAWQRILDEDRENRIVEQIAIMKGDVPHNTENVYSGGKRTRSNRRNKKSTRKTYI